MPSKDERTFIGRQLGLSEAKVYKYFWDQAKKEQDDDEIEDIAEQLGIDTERQAQEIIAQDMRNYEDIKGSSCAVKGQIVCKFIPEPYL